MFSRLTGQRGFTMVEIVIVMVIMSLVLAFAGPRIAKSLGGLTLKTTANKVSGILRFARSQAVATGTLHSVIFDIDRHTVYVVEIRPPAEDAPETDETGDAPPGPPESDEPLSVKPRTKRYRLPREVLVTRVTVGSDSRTESEPGGIYQIAFYPNGTSQGAEIVLSDEQEREVLIRVDFLTGSAVLVEQQDEA